MPGFNAMGPNGSGPMSGRGMGHCGGARAFGPGYGYGRPAGRGTGCGAGFGYGRSPRPGWFAVGYGAGDEVRDERFRGALEQRAAFLRSELQRTEALLKGAPVRDGPAAYSTP